MISAAPRPRTTGLPCLVVQVIRWQNDGFEKDSDLRRDLAERWGLVAVAHPSDERGPLLLLGAILGKVVGQTDGKRCRYWRATPLRGGLRRFPQHAQ